jgi:hypothetical protein
MLVLLPPTPLPLVDLVLAAVLSPMALVIALMSELLLLRPSTFP